MMLHFHGLISPLWYEGGFQVGGKQKWPSFEKRETKNDGNQGMLRTRNFGKLYNFFSDFRIFLKKSEKRKLTLKWYRELEIATLDPLHNNGRNLR